MRPASPDPPSLPQQAVDPIGQACALIVATRQGCIVARWSHRGIAFVRTEPSHAIAARTPDALQSPDVGYGVAERCALDSDAPYRLWYAKSPVAAGRTPAGQAACP